jgi:hypothetical protein
MTVVKVPESHTGRAKSQCRQSPQFFDDSCTVQCTYIYTDGNPFFVIYLCECGLSFSGCPAAVLGEERRLVK